MSTSVNRRLTRRRVIELLGAVGGATLAAACGESSAAPTAPSTAAGADTTAGVSNASAACVISPSETIGPYPSLTDLFRGDVREGKSGVPLTVILTIVNVNSTCTPVTGANVEIWQCDAEGHYSQYSQPGYDGRAETYLRGIQTSDGSGRVTFTTIYPGWYQGRATHIHVDVSVGGRSVKVTQMAFPEGINASVYATGVYAARGQNPQSNSGDMVFADSLSSELAVVSGDTVSGYTATLTVGIAV